MAKSGFSVARATMVAFRHAADPSVGMSSSDVFSMQGAAPPHGAATGFESPNGAGPMISKE
jgi:hypothetical protein